MMTDQEAIQMMQRCRDEIRLLRSQIAHLTPLADAYENIVTVLRLLPKPSVGMGEDLAWALDKRIKEIETALKAQTP